jgi:ParB/RepB/Spo0J family partition protein
VNTKLISITRINSSTGNHRFKDKEVSELMSSMKHNGQLCPIKLRREKGSRFSVVYGNRRLNAAKKLGWTKIECIIDPKTFTKRRFALENVIENFNRLDPSTEDYTVAMDNLRALGMSNNEIASALGVPPSKIKAYAVLRDGLPKNIAYKVRSMDRNRPNQNANEIGVAAAQQIAGVRAGRKRVSVKMANDLAKISRNIPAEKFRHICKQINNGATLPKAVKMMDSYELVRFNVFIPKKAKKYEAIRKMKAILKKSSTSLGFKIVYPEHMGR